MPTVEQITAAFDYFTAVEDAMASVFITAGVKCFTPLGEQPEEGEADGALTMQKHRPRVEIVVGPGSNMGRLWSRPDLQPSAGHMRELARRAPVQVIVVTKANIKEHRAFLIQALYILDNVAVQVNNERRLVNHRMQMFTIKGGDQAYDQEEGVFVTTLDCEMDVSVKEAALQALSS